jgi:hypothetical protein
MASQGEDGWSRRKFLQGPTLAATAVVLGLKSESAAAEPPLETTRIRIHDAPITCFAPVYIADGLLKAEGFTDVQYIKTPLNEGPTKALAEGKIDITQNDTARPFDGTGCGRAGRSPRRHPYWVLGTVRQRFGSHTERSERQDRSRSRTQQPSGLRRRSGHLRWPGPAKGHHLDQP